MARSIQWYPGHMTKAKRQMEQSLKMVDFVIEIRDARIPFSSKNPMLDELVKNKPRLIVLSKKDMAEAEKTAEWIHYFQTEGVAALALDLTAGRYKNDIVKASRQLCAPLIEKQKRRGIRPRPLRAMVCGIPNVGKSTLINALAGRKAAQTANKPGVTKSLQWIRLGKDIELLDTPGVLWPKFEDQTIGLKLALIGSINDTIVPMDDLALYACSWLGQNHPEVFEDYYQVPIHEQPYDTLQEIARKRGYLKKGEIDDDRLMKAFIKDIRDCRCGTFTWEMPND